MVCLANLQIASVEKVFLYSHSLKSVISNVNHNGYSLSTESSLRSFTL